jgi:molybdopterin molybdotransferase
MLNYNDAFKLILNEISKLRLQFEEVPLIQSTGRYLAEDIVSDIDMPPFDNSAMDGYAIKFNEGKKSWRIIGEIIAGGSSEIQFDEDSCIAIMTGGKIPDNADTVLAIEDVSVEGDKITLNHDIKLKKGSNIRYRAEYLKKDSLVLQRNTKIETNHIPALANYGKRFVKVYKSPVIGILSTGNELIDIDFTPIGSQIRVTNLYSIIENVLGMKMNPINYGIIPDKKESIREIVKKALNEHIDILITTGAVSVGKFDFLKEVLLDEGIEIIFWKANIKPGKPILFGKYQKGNSNKLIFGLPGNPVSTFVNFRIFIKRAFDEYFGNKEMDVFPAILKDSITKKDGKIHFICGVSKFDSDTREIYVSKTLGQSSGNIFGLTNANCLIIIEESVNEIKKGEKVLCIKI